MKGPTNSIFLTLWIFVMTMSIWGLQAEVQSIAHSLSVIAAHVKVKP